MTTKLVPFDEDAIEEATSLILKGEVVGFPTETVYGLGADATFERFSRPRVAREIIRLLYTYPTFPKSET